MVAREAGHDGSSAKAVLKLRAAKSRIAALEGNLRPDQVTQIAQSLGVPERDVVDMNLRLDGDVSLNAPLRDDDSSTERQDWLVDDSSSQETALAESEESDIRRAALHAALRVLNDRERSIFVGRRLTDEPITLEAFAGRYSMSRERVRQIEMRAFQKVQKAVKSQVAGDVGPLDRIPISREGWATPAALN